MDLYEVLGIEREAGGSELRRAFNRQARLLHPALNPGDPLAAERFRRVVQAFEVLSDPARRARYDRGEPLPAPPRQAPQVGFEGFDFSELRRASVGFREIFDGVLPGSASRPESAPGEDLEQTTRISFAESLRGAHRRVQILRQDPCPICSGSGETSLAPAACSRCDGKGQLRARRGHMVFTRTCPDCGGHGRLAQTCARCEGEGRLMQGEWLEVEVPAGVASGSRVRLPGAGNAGRRGGPPGDFVLVLEVEEHPIFRREGDDLFCQVPVTAGEAAGGAHVEVPTPDGPMTIQIAAGTQSGQRLRLRKRGVPQLGGRGRGDLYVEVRVLIPAVTDERGRELLRELAQREPADPRGALLAQAKTLREG